MSQLQYRNENQNCISNFVFQLIKKKTKKKKRNGTLGTPIGNTQFKYLLLTHIEI